MEVTISGYTPVIKDKTIICSDTKEKIPLKVITVPDNITPVHLELYQQCITADIYNTYPMKLLNCLIENVNEDGEIKMSHQTMSGLTGISTATIYRLLSKFTSAAPPILIKMDSRTYKFNPQLISLADLSHTYGIVYRHVSDNPIPENTNIEVTITDAETHV